MLADNEYHYCLCEFDHSGEFEQCMVLTQRAGSFRGPAESATRCLHHGTIIFDTYNMLSTPPSFSAISLLPSAF